MTYVEINQSRLVDVKAVLARSPVKCIPGAEEKFTACLRLSQRTWTGFIDGEIACVYGLISPTILSEQAYLWLITTETAERHKFIIARYSQIWIADILTQYDLIIGHCLRSNKSAIKWLKWLGAEFGYPTGEAIPFSIRAKKWQIQ